MQAEGNVTARGNVLINPAGEGMRFQPHHDVPKNIDITRNFIATARRSITLTQPSPAYRQSLTNNTVIAPPRNGNAVDTAPPLMPPFSADLARWLQTHERGQLAPLLAVANRMCSPLTDTPHARMVWQQSELRNHPVCTLMQLIGAPRAAVRDAAMLREVDSASRRYCSTP